MLKFHITMFIINEEKKIIKDTRILSFQIINLRIIEKETQYKCMNHLKYFVCSGESIPRVEYTEDEVKTW